MSEQDMRKKIIKVLKPLDAVSVENPAYPGTPDVNFIEGWIELKWLRSWPKRQGVVKLDHFTTQQRVWLFRRSYFKGKCFLLLQVRKEWLLFDGITASEHVGKVDRETLYKIAHRSWPDGLRELELLECMKNY